MGCCASKPADAQGAPAPKGRAGAFTDLTSPESSPSPDESQGVRRCGAPVGDTPPANGERERPPSAGADQGGALASGATASAVAAASAPYTRTRSSTDMDAAGGGVAPAAPEPEQCEPNAPPSMQQPRARSRTSSTTDTGGAGVGAIAAPAAAPAPAAPSEPPARRPSALAAPAPAAPSEPPARRPSALERMRSRTMLAPARKPSAHRPPLPPFDGLPELSAGVQVSRLWHYLASAPLDVNREHLEWVTQQRRFAGARAELVRALDPAFSWEGAEFAELEGRQLDRLRTEEVRLLLPRAAGGEGGGAESSGAEPGADAERAAPAPPAAGAAGGGAGSVPAGVLRIAHFEGDAVYVDGPSAAWLEARGLPGALLPRVKGATITRVRGEVRAVEEHGSRLGVVWTHAERPHTGAEIDARREEDARVAKASQALRAEQDRLKLSEIKDREELARARKQLEPFERDAQPRFVPRKVLEPIQWPSAPAAGSAPSAAGAVASAADGAAAARDGSPWQWCAREDVKCDEKRSAFDASEVRSREHSDALLDRLELSHRLQLADSLRDGGSLAEHASAFDDEGCCMLAGEGWQVRARPVWRYRVRELGLRVNVLDVDGDGRWCTGTVVKLGGGGGGGGEGGGGEGGGEGGADALSVRVDNTQRVIRVSPVSPRTLALAPVYAYAEAERVCVLGPKGALKEAAVTRAPAPGSGSRHGLSDRLGELDLNEYNHARAPAPIADESAGSAVAAYAKRLGDKYSTVEDAITGRTLQTADQLLLINTDASTSAVDQTYGSRAPQDVRWVRLRPRERLAPDSTVRVRGKVGTVVSSHGGQSEPRSTRPTGGRRGVAAADDDSDDFADDYGDDDGDGDDEQGEDGADGSRAVPTGAETGARASGPPLSVEVELGGGAFRVRVPASEVERPEALYGLQLDAWRGVRDIKEVAQQLLAPGAGRERGAHDSTPVLIHAGPGTGKTWSMHQLFYYLLNVLRTAPAADRWLPVVLYAQKLTSYLRAGAMGAELGGSSAFARFAHVLHEYVRLDELYAGEDARLVMHALRARRLIVLVDGIDEAAEQRPALHDFLRALVSSGVRLIATSRPEGVRLEAFARHFVIMNLAPLSEEQQDKAVLQQLQSNDVFLRLKNFADVRKEHDKVFLEMPEPTRRALAGIAERDDFQRPPGGFEPSMRQQSVRGEVCAALRDAEPPASGYIQELCAALTDAKLRELDGALLGGGAARAPDADVARAAAAAWVEGVPADAQQVAAAFVKLVLLDPAAGAPSALWRRIVARTDQLYASAEVARPEFVRTMKHFERRHKVRVEVAPLKDPVRVFEKASNDYAGRFDDGAAPEACVLDVVRCRVMCPHGNAMLAIAAELAAASRQLRIVRCKNFYHPEREDPTHYRRILYNLELEHESGFRHFAEVQLVHTETFALNEDRHAYEEYAFFRSSLAASYDASLQQNLNFMIESRMQLFDSICSVPVLLSILILILDQGMAVLPADRFDLYRRGLECAVHKFIDGGAQRLPAQARAPAVLLRLMRSIAQANHRERRREFTLQHVEDALTADDERAIWRALVAACRADPSVGLPLIKVIELGEAEAEAEAEGADADAAGAGGGGGLGSGLFQFKHLSFQEALFVFALLETGAGAPPVDAFWGTDGSNMYLPTDEVAAKTLQEPWYANAITIGGAHLGELLGRHRPTWVFRDYMQIGADAPAMERLLRLLDGTRSVVRLSINAPDVPELESRLGAALRHSHTIESVRLGTFELSVRDLRGGGASELSYNYRSHAARLTSRHLDFMAELLAVNRASTSLCIRGHDIGDAGALALARALRANKALTALELIGAGVGDEGAQALAHALVANKTLRTLTLKESGSRSGRLTELTARGARSLARALRADDAALRFLRLNLVALPILELKRASTPLEFSRTAVPSSKLEIAFVFYLLGSEERLRAYHRALLCMGGLYPRAHHGALTYTHWHSPLERSEDDFATGRVSEGRLRAVQDGEGDDDSDDAAVISDDDAEGDGGKAGGDDRGARGGGRAATRGRSQPPSRRGRKAAARTPKPRPSPGALLRRLSSKLLPPGSAIRKKLGAQLHEDGGEEGEEGAGAAAAASDGGDSGALFKVVGSPDGRIALRQLYGGEDRQARQLVWSWPAGGPTAPPQQAAADMYWSRRAAARSLGPSDALAMPTIDWTWLLHARLARPAQLAHALGRDATLQWVWQGWRAAVRLGRAPGAHTGALRAGEAVSAALARWALGADSVGAEPGGGRLDRFAFVGRHGEAVEGLRALLAAQPAAPAPGALPSPLRVHMAEARLSLDETRALAAAVREEAAVESLTLDELEIDLVALRGGVERLVYDRAGAPSLSERDAIVIGELLASNQSARGLSVRAPRERSLGVAGVRALLAALIANSTLTEVALVEIGVDQEACEVLADVLRSNRTLTALRVRDRSMDSSGAARLGGALRDNSALAHLTLRAVRLGVQQLRVGAGALALHDRRLHALDAACIAELLAANTAATSLDLSGGRMGADGASALIRAAARWRAPLRALDLDNVIDRGMDFPSRPRKAWMPRPPAGAALPADSPREPPDAAEPLGALAELLAAKAEVVPPAAVRLGGANVDTASMAALAKPLLSTRCALTSLDLAAARLSNGAIRALATTLAGACALRHLGLARALCTLTSTDVPALRPPRRGTGAARARGQDPPKPRAPPSGDLLLLASALETNSALTSLDVSSNLLGAAWAEELARALGKNKRTALARLELRRAGVGDDGAVALAGALQKQQRGTSGPTLTHLDLTQNWISERGAASFATCLRDEPASLQLSLALNSLTPRGCDALLDAWDQHERGEDAYVRL